MRTFLFGSLVVTLIVLLALRLLTSMIALPFPASPAQALIELTEADAPEHAELDELPSETAGHEDTSQSDGPMRQEEDDDDGPDVLLTALLTTAGFGGAAVLFTLGYLLRRRIGFDPHRPPEDDEDGGGEH